MGKALRDLLVDFKFDDERFNPRNVKEDMISSKETGLKTEPTKILGLDVEGVKLPYDKQYTLLTNSALNIYGADAPRILLRGKVDINKITKKVVNRVARIAGGLLGNASGPGTFVRNSISSLVSVKQPSDTISGNKTENGLYTSMEKGIVKNEKNAITGLLSQYRTPSQFKEQVGDIVNGDVKIGGAVVDEITNLSFKGLGWVASKLSLGKQDSGKTNGLKNSLKTFTDVQSVSRFPSVAAESIAKINKAEKPTGVVIGQNQFIRSGTYPDMYDDLKTGLTIDGVPFNPQTYTFIGNLANDYLLKNGDERSGFVIGGAGAVGSENELVQYPNLGFNDNSNIQGARRQSFTEGLVNTHKLHIPNYAKAGNEFLQNYRLVKANNSDESFIYKIPDIVSDGKPTRFSKNVVDKAGKINYNLFGGYSDKKASPINGDHREKSLRTLLPKERDGGLDLIKISIDGNALMANITGLTDTATPSWGDAKGIGSPYKFYFYESFEREISFKAQIYATSTNSLPAVWKKANEIMQLTDGKSGGTLGVQGKMVRLLIGDFIKTRKRGAVKVDKEGKPVTITVGGTTFNVYNYSAEGIWGFVSACTMTVPDISPWEIQNNRQAPFVCELDITFKVVHEHEDQEFYWDIAMDENKTKTIPAFETNLHPSTLTLPQPNVQLNRDDIEKKLKNLYPKPNISDLLKIKPLEGIDSTTELFAAEKQALRDQWAAEDVAKEKLDESVRKIITPNF